MTADVTAIPPSAGRAETARREVARGADFGARLDAQRRPGPTAAPARATPGAQSRPADDTATGAAGPPQRGAPERQPPVGQAVARPAGALSSRTSGGTAGAAPADPGDGTLSAGAPADGAFAAADLSEPAEGFTDDAAADAVDSTALAMMVDGAVGIPADPPVGAARPGDVAGMAGPGRHDDPVQQAVATMADLHGAVAPSTLPVEAGGTGTAPAGRDGAGLPLAAGLAGAGAPGVPSPAAASAEGSRPGAMPEAGDATGLAGPTRLRQAHGPASLAAAGSTPRRVGVTSPDSAAGSAADGVAEGAVDGAAGDAPPVASPRADRDPNRDRAGGLAALLRAAEATPAGGSDAPPAASATTGSGAAMAPIGAAPQGLTSPPPAPQPAQFAAASLPGSPHALVPEAPPAGQARPLAGAQGPWSSAGAIPGLAIPGLAMAAAARGAPLSAGQQLGRAMVALGGAGPDGVQTLAVRLDPGELGRVEVRIERADGGPALVQVIAEKPETLALLQRDHAGLARALDQAGVGQHQGRSLSFSLSDGGQDQGASHRHPGGRGPDPSGQFRNAPELERTVTTVAARWLRAGVDVIA